MKARRGIAVLGSTGSIGVSTLDVVARHPERFEVIALSAHTQTDRLFEQCLAHRPRFAVLPTAEGARVLRARLKEAGAAIEVHVGAAALADIAALAEVDYVMAAIVGAAGLQPALAAVRAGKTVLLANKESLVMSGDIFMQAVRTHGARLMPIDSEHNAIFQTLPREYGDGLGRCGVLRIVLTASGGPFRCTEPEQLANVTPEQACAHPNWVMGRKISVDSATMMNKGLEVIEAKWLFDATPEQIEIVIHPQSVIHSMVAYSDGSVLAQLGNPDMRTPIAYALGYPERIASGVAPLDLVQISRLEFEPLDLRRFPCVGLAYQALRAGGSAPAVLNAANEIAVAAFLDRRIRFTEIASIIAETLERLPGTAVTSIDVLVADQRARAFASGQLAHRALSA